MAPLFCRSREQEVCMLPENNTFRGATARTTFSKNGKPIESVGGRGGRPTQLRGSRLLGMWVIPRTGLWSRGVARWFRWGLSVADPFVCRCLTSSALLPFPHPAHRTGRADLPHPALGEDARNRRSHCM